jgi:hypothetical protein
MQPGNPFQTQGPTDLTSKLITWWKWIVSHLSKIYIWLPVGLLLTTGVSVGAYYLLSGKQLPTSSDLPKTIAGIVGTSDEPGKTDQPDSKTDKKEADKKDSEKKKKQQATQDKKATGDKTQVDKPTTGGSDSKDESQDNPPVPAPTPAPPVPPAPSNPSGGYVKPNSSNTGPRYSTTRTLSPDQALAELRSTGRLSRVTITGRLQLSGSDGRNWLIEDSIIRASSSYGLQTYSSLSSFTGTYAERPIFRYVEVIGRAALGTGSCSAVVYGSNVVLEHADLYGCDDAVKASSNVSIISSWLHDNDHPSGAHCDSLQIRSGTNILVVGSRFDSYVAYSSDGSQVPDGDTCSGGLQTGSVSGTISARFENNWFAGGHYTIRGWGSRDAGYSMSYVFRNNKWMRHGTSVALGLTNLPPNRYGPVYGTLDDFDSSNVWEDTGLPVRN